MVSVAPGGAFTTFLTDVGSVYYCGYGLGPEMSHVVKPASLSILRRLWNSSDGKIRALVASLHYAVATVDGTNWMLWGRFPGKRLVPSIHSYSPPHKASEQAFCVFTQVLFLCSFLYPEVLK